MRISQFLLIVFAIVMFVTMLAAGFQHGLIDFRNRDRNVVIEDNAKPVSAELKRLKQYGKQLKKYALKNKYNTSVCFLVDMKLHSGKRRFFIYNLRTSNTFFAIIMLSLKP